MDHRSNEVIFNSENEGQSKVRQQWDKLSCKGIIKRTLPITEWLPKYNLETFLHDLLAGFTVGLTEIPQGIAYAGVAGLSAQYGLYSGFMGCFMYAIFGSCKDINIGPTAIMALMVQPHVYSLGADMAVLLTFLAGCVIFCLGLLHLGFLVEFFSYPVIAGFTSAAALSIASSQFKGLLGLKGKANEFLETIKIVFENISQTKFADATLGILTIVALVAMKEMRRYGWLQFRQDKSRGRNILAIAIFMLSLARNAIAVLFGTILAWSLQRDDNTNPFELTKDVKGGLPGFNVPPFHTNVNGTEYNFSDMANEFSTTIVFAPLVAILESIAIAKAFSKGRTVDATQEMFALGICNIMGSFVKSMPVTGSFTRTAVNNASGVKTPLGGILTGVMVLLALSFLTSAFYYIPKATLAAVVICAMFYLFDFQAFAVLWKTKKIDLIPLITTLLVGLFWSLEYGILVGTALNIVFVLYTSARPKVDIEALKIADSDIYLVTPRNAIEFPSAEYIRDKIIADCNQPGNAVVLNGKYISSMDATVAKSLSVLADELSSRNQQTVFLDFKPALADMLIGINKDLQKCLKEGILEHVVKEISEDVEMTVNTIQ